MTTIISAAEMAWRKGSRVVFRGSSLHFLVIITNFLVSCIHFITPSDQVVF
jgi:hypothetical protein